MRYTLENEILAVEIDSFGAELRSIRRKADDFEYMWQADPRYWGRTSPVLFPFVGVPKDKEYRYAGKTYPMGQHGFARDMEFTLERTEQTKIWFVLASTEEGQVILDPFCGSGTTGVEAVRFGRKFIGIDVSEEYLEISKRRLEKVANDK